MYSSELLEKQDLFQIKSLESYSPEIGKLVSMMNYARITTFDLASNLTVEELDFLVDENSNSIGMLLSHIASVEAVYYISTIEQREINEEEIENWKPSLNLGDLGREKIKGNPLEFYIVQLEEVRKKTLEAFKGLNDEWLYEESDFWDNRKANNYFKWFHVLEDEINHRGQMLWIAKRARKKFSL